MTTAAYALLLVWLCSMALAVWLTYHPARGV